MRVFKLTDHNLLDYQNHYDFESRTDKNTELTLGIKVCTQQRLKHIGTIVGIGEKTKRFPRSETLTVSKVEVLWLTGPKRGKQEECSTASTINFDWYRKSVQDYANELKDINDEAEMARPT